MTTKFIGMVYTKKTVVLRRLWSGYLRVVSDDSDADAVF